MRKTAEPLNISVKKLLIEKDISQKQLAEIFHRDKSTISHTLAGRRQKLLKEIYRFVKSFKPKRAA